MTKRQLIDRILTLNRSARPAFLAQFDEDDLSEYLAHLMAVRAPRHAGEAARWRGQFSTGAQRYSHGQGEAPQVGADAPEPVGLAPPTAPHSIPSGKPTSHAA